MPTTTDLPVRPHIVQDGTNLVCMVCGEGHDIDPKGSIATEARLVGQFIGAHALGECCPHCHGQQRWTVGGLYGREFTCPCVASLRDGTEPDWSDL